MGEFRVGDPNFANYLDSLLPPPNYYRITHTNDGVPQTDTQAMGFEHHATEFWELEPFGAGTTQQCPGQDNPVSERGWMGENLVGVLTREGL